MASSKKTKIIYLAGTSYSGSTLLAFVMNSHPAVVSTGETSLNRTNQKKKQYHHPCTCGCMLHKCQFWQEIFMKAQEKGYNLHSNNWINDYKYKSNLLYKIFSVYRVPPWAKVFRNLVDNLLPLHSQHIKTTNKVNIVLFNEALRISQAELFFDTTKHLMRLYYLLQVPELDIKIIRWVRDARAYANSGLRKGLKVEDSVTTWLNFHKAFDDLASNLPSEKVIQMRYEDFCIAPKQHYKKLCDFFGIDHIGLDTIVSINQHHILGNQNTSRRKTFEIQLNEKWRTQLTQAQLETVGKIAGDYNRILGYS